VKNTIQVKWRNILTACVRNMLWSFTFLFGSGQYNNLSCKRNCDLPTVSGRKSANLAYYIIHTTPSFPPRCAGGGFKPVVSCRDSSVVMIEPQSNMAFCPWTDCMVGIYRPGSGFYMYLQRTWRILLEPSLFI